MESIIVFSGSSLVIFLVLTICYKRLNISLPEYRILRSLGRTAELKENEDNPKDKSKKLEKSKLLHGLLTALVKKDKGPSYKDTQLAAAGLKNWSSSEWKVFNYIIGITFAVLGLLIGIPLHLPLIPRLQVILIGFIIGFLSPNYWLKTKVKQRNDEIVKTLPDILDLILVSVEAGLGLDAAIMKVVEKQKGILAQEFNIVLQEIKVGKPRRDALRDMSKRNNVEDLNNVIAALVQADQLGISMGSVLRSQSEQIREKRKQRAQEQAQKAPVKIMIPLVFFIFPSIFIVILGPAFLQILAIFGN